MPGREGVDILVETFTLRGVPSRHLPKSRRLSCARRGARRPLQILRYRIWNRLATWARPSASGRERHKLRI